jgi:hypothetical protein
MQSTNDEHEAAVNKMMNENEMMKGWLREFVTPPMSYGKKKELVEAVTLYVEGWE